MAFPIGVGLRPTHYPYLETRPQTPIQWFEAVSENYMSSEGRPKQILKLIREDYPVALHGIGLSIGSADGINESYLKKLQALVAEIEPFIVSDHLCWTGLAGQPTHDLLPLPYNKETIDVVVKNIDFVQNQLKRPLLLENVSSYLSYKTSEMTEWEFLKEIQRKSGCHLLLDLNNVYVNSVNHHFDAKDFLKDFPLDQVKQIHLAGHTNMGDYLFDTHSDHVCDPVWELLQHTSQLAGEEIPVLIEWDDDIPEWPILEAEAMKAVEKWQVSK